MLVVFLLVAIWVLLAGPGRVFEYRFGLNPDLIHIRHGWPWVHFENVTDASVGEKAPFSPKSYLNCDKNPAGSRHWNNQNFRYLELNEGQFKINRVRSFSEERVDDKPLWMAPGNWSHSGDAVRINWPELTWNLIVLFLALALAIVYLEIRFRKRGLSFSILDILLLVCVLGTGLGIRERTKYYNHVRASMQNLESIQLDAKQEKYNFDVWPDWIERLVGHRYLPKDKSLTFKKLVVNFETISQQDLAMAKSSFHLLKELDFAYVYSADDVAIPVATNLQGLKELHLIAPNVQNWKKLRQIDGLELLRVSKEFDDPSVILNQGFFESVAEIGSLEKLELEDCFWEQKHLDELRTRNPDLEVVTNQ